MNQQKEIMIRLPEVYKFHAVFSSDHMDFWTLRMLFFLFDCFDDQSGVGSFHSFKHISNIVVLFVIIILIMSGWK